MIDMRDKRRDGDRLVREMCWLLDRRCESCGEWFRVAPNRPDTRYCKSETCRKRRARAKKKGAA